MKKRNLLILLLTMLLAFSLTACGGEKKDTKTSKKDVVPEPGTDHTYKDIMVPFDQVVPENRIVLIQNALNFKMMGFYTEETKPVTEPITYNGQTTEAYAISYVLDFLNNEIKGDVTVTDAEGNTKAFTAEEFSGMYVIVDFTSTEPVILCNPATGAQTTLAYAVTSEGEGIYSITADTAHNSADIIKACGWSADASYRLVATDKFYIPVEPEYLTVGQLRGTLSGALNASFEGMVIASGKINDPVYFEKTEKVEK